MTNDLKLDFLIILAVVVILAYIWDARKLSITEWTKRVVGHSYASNSVMAFGMVGRRFCKVDMRGCMGDVRGQEKWGVVIGVDVGRTERGLVYDGGQHPDTRARYRKLGQDTWLCIRYDDGSETFEPVWWTIDRGDHLEYPT